MFEKEAGEYAKPFYDMTRYDYVEERTHVREAFQKGAVFGYNKAKEELTERLDDATEIIEQMKDLFFDCWQEKGYNAIKFEQKVNDFLKENNYGTAE